MGCFVKLTTFNSKLYEFFVGLTKTTHAFRYSRELKQYSINNNNVKSRINNTNLFL